MAVAAEALRTSLVRRAISLGSTEPVAEASLRSSESSREYRCLVVWRGKAFSAGAAPGELG